MSVQVSEVFPEPASAGAGRPWYFALGVSSATHMCIVLLLAGWTSVGSSQRRSTVDTRWTANEDPQRIETVETLTLAATKVSQNAGGSRASSSMLASPQRLQVESPVSIETLSNAPVDDVLTSGGLADDVGFVLSESDYGDSTGDGTGEGDGQGDGFFGMSAAGRSFVYVVDCSLSMNHPHASPAKTRFKRLKLELVKSIGRMEPSQQFFIIFFNQQVVPMPAQSMQRASSETKQRFLRWVTKVRADGDTDPRGAIGLAMKLNPDVIYFLTDGSFEFRTKKMLNKLSQKRVAIHTFALGNREGEPILRGLAERNRGEYHYIP